MVTREDVAYVARLSRIDLDQHDLDAFVPHMQEILAYVEKLNELDTANIEPMPHVLPMSNVIAEDSPAASIPCDDALQSAPETSDGFFRVPPIID
jgi:aspartyl-tRNA(Asn)/glutamyl-tRNA(Gln) amidotransferase subunit C